jgi:hypothetical protein
MAKFGRDFQSYTAPLLYMPSNPAGLWIALGLAALLLLANGILQTAAGAAVLSLFFGGGFDDPKRHC